MHKVSSKYTEKSAFAHKLKLIILTVLKQNKDVIYFPNYIFIYYLPSTRSTDQPNERFVVTLHLGRW